MNKTLLILLMATLFAFHVKGQDVYYDSITLPPHLHFSNNVLEMKTSADGVKLDKVKIKVDVAQKEIVLSAKALKKESFRWKIRHTFDLNRYKITDITSFKVYWLNPDNSKIPLTVYSKTKPYYTSPIFPFREGDKWFYVDSNFNKLSDEFDFVYPFYHNYAVVQINNKYALINKAMMLLTQPIFDEIRYQSYHNDLKTPYFYVTKNKKQFQIDTTGQEFRESYIGPWTCGGDGGYMSKDVVVYKSNGKMGLQTLFDTITPAIYDTIMQINKPNAHKLDFVVNIGKKYGVIDSQGKEKLPIIYDEIRIDVYDNWYYDPDKEMLVCIDDKCGFVDRTFQALTELKYTDGLPFKLGFSLVQTTDGKWGYIDRQGKEYWR